MKLDREKMRERLWHVPNAGNLGYYASLAEAACAEAERQLNETGARGDVGVALAPVATRDTAPAGGPEAGTSRSRGSAERPLTGQGHDVKSGLPVVTSPVRDSVLEEEARPPHGPEAGTLDHEAGTLALVRDLIEERDDALNCGLVFRRKLLDRAIAMITGLEDQLCVAAAFANAQGHERIKAEAARDHWKARADKAEAEVARLREVLNNIASGSACLPGYGLADALAEVHAALAPKEPTP